MVTMYSIEEYVTKEGDSPFGKWLLSLKDKKARAKIMARISRAQLGNLGDWKKLKGENGLFEMREHYGQGYRAYFSIVNGQIVLLLAGSEKSDQKVVVRKAKEYLEDYIKRSRQ